MATSHPDFISAVERIVTSRPAPSSAAAAYDLLGGEQAFQHLHRCLACREELTVIMMMHITAYTEQKDPTLADVICILHNVFFEYVAKPVFADIRELRLERRYAHPSHPFRAVRRFKAYLCAAGILRSQGADLLGAVQGHLAECEQCSKLYNGIEAIFAPNAKAMAERGYFATYAGVRSAMRRTTAQPITVAHIEGENVTADVSLQCPASQGTHIVGGTVPQVLQKTMRVAREFSRDTKVILIRNVFRDARGWVGLASSFTLFGFAGVHQSALLGIVGVLLGIVSALGGGAFGYEVDRRPLPAQPVQKLPSDANAEVVKEQNVELPIRQR